MVVGVAPNGTGDHAGATGGGVPGPGLSPAETISHMSMWVMAASPLLTCNDARNMSKEILETLTNPEVLAVHKDPLAKMAVRIDVGGGVEEGHASNLCTSEYSVYGKDLADGSSAVMVLNRGTASTSVTLPMEDVGDSLHTTYAVRDLWARKDLSATPAVQHTIVTVPAHGVRLLRFWPMAPAPAPSPAPPAPHPPCPSGFSAHAGGFWYNTDPCPRNDFSNCSTDPKLNNTVPKCAAKCVATSGCVAFEVFLGGAADDHACYIFLKTMTPPFTPNADSVTCIRGGGADKLSTQGRGRAIGSIDT